MVKKKGYQRQMGRGFARFNFPLDIENNQAKGIKKPRKISTVEIPSLEGS